jgi:Winged helix domain
LISAGLVGVTPIDRPAPRWSHYVYKLRRAGIHVETIDEAHGGPYAGHHARYILRTPLRVVELGRQNDAKPKRKDGASTFAHLPMPAGIGR